MSATDRFLASTRGRILAFLLREPATVARLAETFDVSANAVRQHLNGLERDGYVARLDVKHTVTRPAAIYRVTRDGEALFPKAYEPVLGALVEEVEEKFGDDAIGVLQNVGARLARKHLPPPEATTEERIDIALDLLTELGAMLEVDRSAGGVVRVEGSSCPLSGVVRNHPDLCRAIAAMLEEIVVLPVEECCRNDTDAPSCRFVIGASG